MYLIDSNCFIEPHRSFCPTDVGISFWNKLRDLALSRVIRSLDKVKNELIGNNDALADWIIANLNRDFFIRFDNPETIGRLSEISNWASASKFYTDKAKRKFLKLDKADIYLVAFASIAPEQWTIVSQEIPAPSQPGEIKLPDVCNKYNVRCIFLKDMFREMHETF